MGVLVGGHRGNGGCQVGEVDPADFVLRLMVVRVQSEKIKSLYHGPTQEVPRNSYFVSGHDFRRCGKTHKRPVGTAESSPGCNPG
jgi:hypothetical protein